MLKMCDNSQITTLLLEAGADPNAKDEDGKTALMKATLCKNFEMVKVLCEAGADPNIQNEDGINALMCAVAAKNDSIYNYLLEIGANPNLADRNGKTVEDWKLWLLLLDILPDLECDPVVGELNSDIEGLNSDMEDSDVEGKIK